MAIADNLAPTALRLIRKEGRPMTFRSVPTTSLGTGTASLVQGTAATATGYGIAVGQLASKRAPAGGQKSSGTERRNTFVVAAQGLALTPVPGMEVYLAASVTGRRRTVESVNTIAPNGTAVLHEIEVGG